MAEYTEHTANGHLHDGMQINGFPFPVSVTCYAYGAKRIEAA